MGSVRTTSIPAPAMTPFFSASRRSSSTTMPPRAVLMRKAVGFMSASVSRLTRSFVPSLRGQWKVSASLRRKISSLLTGSKGQSAGAVLVCTITFMPKASPNLATALPMAP